MKYAENITAIQNGNDSCVRNNDQHSMLYLCPFQQRCITNDRPKRNCSSVTVNVIYVREHHLSR